MKISNEVKVGFIVTASIVALVWGVNFLKGVDIFDKTKKIHAVYDDISGLVRSNSVIVKGYRIGQVKEISFLPENKGKIVITLNIKKDIFIPKNSVAQIINDGILGGKAINIHPGDELVSIADGDTLQSEVIGGFAEQVGPIREKAENLIQALDSVANALHLLLNEKTRKDLKASFESISKILNTFESTAKTFDKMVSGRDSKLNLMIANAESISSNFKNNNEKLSNIITNFSQISDTLAGSNFSAALMNAHKAMAETAVVMEKINRGEGTLGLLVNNDSLYRSLSSSAANLDKLVIDLKDNPKRYVNFSVFGRKAK